MPCQRPGLILGRVQREPGRLHTPTCRNVKLRHQAAPRSSATAAAESACLARLPAARLPHRRAHIEVRISVIGPGAPPRPGALMGHAAVQETFGDARSASIRLRRRRCGPRSAGLLPTRSPAPPSFKICCLIGRRHPRIHGRTRLEASVADRLVHGKQPTHSPGGYRQKSSAKPAMRRAPNTVALSPHRQIHTSVTTTHHRQLPTTQSATADSP
jgi:hypothetical protein